VTKEGVNRRDGGVSGLPAHSDSGRLGSVDHSPADSSLVALGGLDSVEEEKLSFLPEGRLSRSSSVMCFFLLIG
jgi:hypothetical protein